MVCRIMRDHDLRTHGFAVFEADFLWSRWVQVDTLGGNEALFVGRLCSRAVQAGRHQVYGDCIYFLDDSTGMEALINSPLLFLVANMYDMKDGSISVLLSMRWNRDTEVPVTWLFREDEDADVDG
jgi:hypothetical protein